MERYVYGTERCTNQRGFYADIPDSVIRIISHDKMFISGSLDNTVRIWDLGSGDCVRVLNGYPSYVFALSLSPDHSFLRAGCGKGEL